MFYEKRYDGKEQPYKAGRENTLDDEEEEDFSGSPRRSDGIVGIVRTGYFCSKIIHKRLQN